MATVEIEIPSRSVYVAVVRLAIAALARSAGLDEETVDDLKIAVSEACANAVLSNEAASADAPVTVGWTELENQLAIDVSDRGAAYDPDEPGDQFDSQGFSSRTLMSYSLLRSLADDSSMHRRAGGGMTARLLFNR